MPRLPRSFVSLRSLILAAAIVGLALAPSASAAVHAYARIKGQKQGPIEGDALTRGRERSIVLTAFSHSIAAPRDAASGLAAGKRTHRPFVITKELDRATPRLYQAMLTDEVLPEVELVVFAATDKAAKTPTLTVKLINARITEIRMLTPADGPAAQEVSLTYQKIVWTWADGLTAQDDWDPPIAKPQPAPAPMPMPIPKQ